MTALLVLLVVLVLLALAWLPTTYRRRPRRVVETVYEDEPVVEDVVVERDGGRPISRRTRRLD